MTGINARFVQALLLVATGALLFSTPAKAQDGAALYKMKCVGCHGPDGSGSEAGKKLGAHDFHSADVQKESDDEMTMIIAMGKNKMPAYGKTLKPDEIKSLVAYVHSLAGKK